MSDWSKARACATTLSIEVNTDSDGGTGFLLHRTARNLVVTSAWDVIEDLLHASDKHRRRITMIGADKSYSAVANVVGVVRLGDETSDVGLVWVGPPFDQKAIDSALRTLAQSGIKGGHADFSGGGGIVHIEGDPTILLKTPLLEILAIDQLNRGIDVGLMGYPSTPPKDKSPGEIVFFESSVTGFEKPHSYFVDWYGRDGMAQKGISGGPVFTRVGQLAGLVSSFEPRYEAMRIVPAPMLPWVG